MTHDCGFVSGLLSRTAAVACLVAVGFTGSAEAAQVQIDFQATVFEVVEDTQGDVLEGDVFVGYIIYESTTAETTTGNYENAVLEWYVERGQETFPGSGEFGFFLEIFETTGDIFIGPDSFEANLFISIFDPNSQIYLRNGPSFGQSLEAATTQLLAAGPNALSLFGGPDDSEPTEFGIQTDLTFDDTFAVFDYVEVSLVPEPASLAILGLGGVCLLGRRRRVR